MPKKRKPRNRNKTAYYRDFGTHYAIYNESGEHITNVDSWKAIEQFGLLRGYYFRGSLDQCI